MGKGKLTLASRLTEISRAEQEILAAIGEFGYTGADRFAVKLAVEEALANAIKHGNQFDPDKQVHLEFDVDQQRIRIRICDEGGGFDPGDLPDPTLDENLAKPFGRGVMLMRTYMSDVRFSESGQCVTMIKQRSGGLDQAG